jgi:hypothetical protein
MKNLMEKLEALFVAITFAQAGEFDVANTYQKTNFYGKGRNN